MQNVLIRFQWTEYFAQRAVDLADVKLGTTVEAVPPVLREVTVVCNRPHRVVLRVIAVLIQGRRGVNTLLYFLYRCRCVRQVEAHL